jgi:hypothetical protein
MLGALSLAAVVMAAAAVVPAARVARADVASSLAEGGRRSIGSRGTMRLRAWLVATETALALIPVSSGALVAAALERTCDRRRPRRGGRGGPAGGVFPEVHSAPRLYAVPAALLLVAAGIVTAVAGARRVTRIDPLIALRSE